MAEPFAPQEWTGTFSFGRNETLRRPNQGRDQFWRRRQGLASPLAPTGTRGCRLAYRAIWELRAQAEAAARFLTKT